MTVAGTEAVTVRFAEPADDGRLAEIDAATWSPLVTPAPRSAALVFFRPQIAPEDTLVAEAGAVAVGYALLGTPTPLPASAHVQMLRGLAVDPAFQGRGVGRLLVEAAIREARSRGAAKLTLRVLGSNPTALHLYETCGFGTEGVLRGEFLLGGEPVDDHLLARRLDG